MSRGSDNLGLTVSDPNPTGFGSGGSQKYSQSRIWVGSVILEIGNIGFGSGRFETHWVGLELRWIGLDLDNALLCTGIAYVTALLDCRAIYAYV